ncbi:MAG: sigma-70 family RNA polymerase sigma factor [Ruminococcaceae bacterium]|nr:sigma-70 family RNA polymerase sigma factor [Oscillospiraceae bacterium]
MFTLILATLAKLIQPVLGIGSVQNFPNALTKEEENLYFQRKSKGDEEARQILILHNLRLVSHIVRKYYSSSKNQEDLISIGTIGLVKAVDSFNCDNGTKFATYASKCIQNEILMNFRAQKKRACEVSINDTIDVDRDGNPLTYIDVLSSDENMAEEVDRMILTDKALRFVETKLTQRERQIIVMRYGLHGIPEQTQKQISEKLGISRSYVSRIEKSALEKLRGLLT